ncbi:glycosyltransferase [Francisella-like endosymbiont]
MYSTVDLMVVPSKQEGLSNVIMENLSCSTPVVAFDIGVIQI